MAASWKNIGSLQMNRQLADPTHRWMSASTSLDSTVELEPPLKSSRTFDISETIKKEQFAD